MNSRSWRDIHEVDAPRKPWLGRRSKIALLSVLLVILLIITGGFVAVLVGGRVQADEPDAVEQSQPMNESR